MFIRNPFLFSFLFGATTLVPMAAANPFPSSSGGDGCGGPCDPVSAIKITSHTNGTVIDTGEGGLGTGSLRLSGVAPLGTGRVRVFAQQTKLDPTSLTFDEEMQELQGATITGVNECSVQWEISIDGDVALLHDGHNISFPVHAETTGGTTTSKDRADLTVIPFGEDDVLVAEAFLFTPQFRNQLLVYDPEETTLVFAGDLSHQLKAGDGLFSNEETPDSVARFGYAVIVQGMTTNRPTGETTVSNTTVHGRVAAWDEFYTQVNIDHDDDRDGDPDAPQGSISGSVMEDLDKDGAGDVYLAKVLIALSDVDSGVVKGTTLTDSDGHFVFSNLHSSTYVLQETNLARYLDVSDVDGANDNRVVVQLGDDEVSTGNNFVDERLTPAPSGRPTSKPSLSPTSKPSLSPTFKPSLSPTFKPSPSPTPIPSATPSSVFWGSISGSVLEDANNDDIGETPLMNVVLTVFDASEVVVATTLTDSFGYFVFDNIPEGRYQVVETNLANFLDISDSDGANDNMIMVEVKYGEASSDLVFVDQRVRTISGTVLEDTDNDTATGDVALGVVSGDDDGRRLVDFQLGTAGVLKVNPTAKKSTVFKLKISKFRGVREFEMGLTLTVGLMVELMMKGSIDKNGNLPGINVGISAINLPILNKAAQIKFHVTPFYNVNIRGEIDLKYHPKLVAKIGYRKGSGGYGSLVAVDHKLSDVTGDIDLHSKLGFGVALGADLIFVGKRFVDFDYNPQLVLAADTDKKDCDIDWDLDLVVTGQVKIDIKIWKFRVAKYYKDLGFKKDLLDGSIDLPPGLCAVGGGPTSMPTLAPAVDNGGGGCPTVAPTVFEVGQPTACEVLSCCEEECCGAGTSYSAQHGTCVRDSGAKGWNGQYSSTYLGGCRSRTCCIHRCCGDGLNWDGRFCKATISGNVKEDTHNGRY